MGLIVLVGKLKNEQSKLCDWLNPILFKLISSSSKLQLKGKTSQFFSISIIIIVFLHIW
jgi:hypothetical protein